MKTHGMSNCRIYKIWEAIIQRCNNKNSTNYKSYGGRGIRCEWKTFEEFYKDMKDGYSYNLSIDRINNNGNYFKENCRWATRKEQSRNRRDNVVYKGKSIAEWCEELNLNFNTVKARINILGWSMEKSLEINEK